MNDAVKQFVDDLLRDWAADEWAKPNAERVAERIDARLEEWELLCAEADEA